MTIKPETTLEQFREEMQHRVVKYPLNSRPVKEALRFAKKHKDPAFYRIASDKIHAQRQFQRELYGPGQMERLIDFVSLGSLREVVVTLVLVAAGVLGLDVARRGLNSSDENDLYSHMDVEQLATRLGIVLEASNSRQASPASKSLSSMLGDARKAEQDRTGTNAAGLSTADVARIADAVIERLKLKEMPNTLSTANPTKPAESAPSGSANSTTTASSPEFATLSGTASPTTDATPR